MAIFGKKEEKKEDEAPAKKEDKKPVKKDVKKEAKKKPAKKADSPVKEKKAKKPTSDAGARLTKAPGRIIVAPFITEKAVQMTVNNVYVFEVAMDATKNDVKNAIRALYKVSPRKVNIVRRAPRKFVSRFRNRRGTKKGVKKAYVYLKKGEKIDLA
jgi:large subunit ribosomal protein L23